jgi:hypothetical protein
MATNKSKQTGKTPSDLVSELLARKSVFAGAALIGWVLLVGIGYLWFAGKIGLTTASQADRKSQNSPLPSQADGKSEGSPFVHWWLRETDLPLDRCAALTRDVYALTGIENTEIPDVEANSVAQYGWAGSVTSLIACVRTGAKTTVMVISSGPDQSATKDRQNRLQDALLKTLPVGSP